MEVQVREKLRWVCLRKWKLEKLRLRLVLGHVRVRSSSPIDGGLSRGKSSIYTINIYKWLIFHSKTHLVPVTELPFMASKKRTVCATWRTQYSASVRASVSWRFRARDQSIWWEKPMAFLRGKTREAFTGNYGVSPKNIRGFNCLYKLIRWGEKTSILRGKSVCEWWNCPLPSYMDCWRGGFGVKICRRCSVNPSDPKRR